MLPRVILHSLVSADGRMDGFAPDIGQFYEIAARWKEDATLAGSDTVIKAEEEVPEEDARDFDPPAKDPGDRRPLLVIPDSRGRVRSWHWLRKQPYWRDVIALCSRSTPRDYIECLEKRQIECIVAGHDRVDLREALEQLNARHGVEAVRADCGGTLNGALLREGLVSEVSVLVNPSLVGGTSPRSLFREPDLFTPEGVIQLKLIHLEELEGGVAWLRYEAVK